MLHTRKEYINKIMAMKKFVCAVLAFAMAIGCVPKSEDIVLSFDVTDPISKEVNIVCQNKIINVPLTEGKGDAVLKDINAAYLRVHYGMAMKKVYVEKGDNASISFNGSDMDGTFAFSGEKDAAVKYLQNVTFTGLPDEAYALEFDEYLAKMNAKRDDALKLLKANAIKGAGKFVKMETGRIRYMYATPLLMYPVGHMMMAQKPGYQPDESYYEAIRALFVEDDDLVAVDEYRNFIIEAAHVLDEENRNVTKVREKTVAQMNFITDHFKSAKVNESILHYLACSYVDVFGIDGIEEMRSLHSTYVKNPVLLADFAEKFNKWDQSKPGKISPEFKAVDMEGREWTLADFRGKYVYIDMWATWCNPCKRELPYLKELEKKFEGAQITFIGLSTDGDKSKWEKMVKESPMPGVQLYLGPRSAFQKAYNIDGIPRFILLDKEGRIINNNMSRPSSDETAKVLEALDGIRL